jgi:biotin carboxyl carrier protein
VSDQVTPEARVVEATTVDRRVERTAADRAADHAAIAGSVAELLPALIAKLGATGLGELEIREDALRVRLRRPTEVAAGHDGRHGDRGTRGDRTRGSAPAVAAHGGLTAVGPGHGARDGHEGRSASDGRHATRQDEGRAVATSPAVGIYHPRSEARAGSKVRAGDRLGSVDMLGVPQEVVAPTDGLIGASLVEPGDAVEYGQELVVIEFATSAPAGSVGAPPTPTPDR